MRDYRFKIVLRREFFYDTFTGLSFYVGNRKFNFNTSRPHRKTDKPFHWSWGI